MTPFEIEFSAEADKDLNRIRAFYRSTILDAIEEHLQYAPTQISRSRIKRLHLLGSPAYRLRVDDYRVYYDIDEDARMVKILRVLSKADSLGYLRAVGGQE